MQFCSVHRTPRAGVDPIDRAETALAVISLAVHRPLVAETVAIVLDDQRRGMCITVVSGTTRPDDVVEVAERMSEIGDELVGGLVLASVRPDGGVLDGDVDRWCEASDVASSHGVELVEWFVVGRRGIACPRDLLGESPRW